jgi:hypothetical protein
MRALSARRVTRPVLRRWGPHRGVQLQSQQMTCHPGRASPFHRDIDVGGIDLDREAGATGHLSCDDGRARSAEWLVPGDELFSIGRLMHSTGFWVPWPCPSSSRALIVQSVDCLRSPLQFVAAVPRTAYQQGSCCQ